MNQESFNEINFDGLIGPTHHYGGLSYGNIASKKHQGLPSNPKEAALQGLEKMKYLHDLKIPQAIMPPHERPHLKTLKAIGFEGTDEEILSQVSRDFYELFQSVSSSSAMWTANAATMTPSSDTFDHKVHFTPANLITNFHRSIETEFTSKILKKIFPDPKYFVHHDPLPRSLVFADEGAANHIRFQQGFHLFVYGRNGFNENLNEITKFPARQTLEASKAIARLHLIQEPKTLFLKQNKKAIDQGVFHNDVISTGNENLFFYHEDSFENCEIKLSEFIKKAHLKTILVQEKQISIQEAVNSYLFNSQIVTLPSGKMLLLAPMECQMNPKVHSYLNEIDKNLISEIHYIDLRQSMLNGGGPACLRFRVILNPKEQQATNASIFLNETLYQNLKAWIHKYYRDRLEIKDLQDKTLLNESRQALDALTKILNLGSIYDFQK